MFTRTPFRLIVVLLLSSTSSWGAITAFWQQNEITKEAILNDSELAFMQSWSLMVTTDGDWTSAGLRAVLPWSPTPLYFYVARAFEPFNSKPPADVPIPPKFYFTTYATSPGDTGHAGTQPNLLGGFPEGQPRSFGHALTTIPGTFSVSWGDLVTSPPGSYEIARLTFPRSVFPTVHWDPASDPELPGSSNTSQVNPDSTVFIPQIPEPASLGLIGLAGLLMVRRDRR